MSGETKRKRGRPVEAYEFRMAASMSIDLLKNAPGARAKDCDDAARRYFEQDPNFHAFFAASADALAAIARTRRRVQKGVASRIMVGRGALFEAMSLLHRSVPVAEPAKKLVEAQRRRAADARKFFADNN